MAPPFYSTKAVMQSKFWMCHNETFKQTSSRSYHQAYSELRMEYEYLLLDHASGQWSVVYDDPDSYLDITLKPNNFPVSMTRFQDNILSDFIILASHCSVRIRGWYNLDYNRLLNILTAIFDPRFNFQRWGMILDMVGDSDKNSRVAHMFLEQELLTNILISRRYLEDEPHYQDRIRRGFWKLAFRRHELFSPSCINGLPYPIGLKTERLLIWNYYHGGIWRARSCPFYAEDYANQECDIPRSYSW